MYIQYVSIMLSILSLRHFLMKNCPEKINPEIYLEKTYQSSFNRTIESCTQYAATSSHGITNEKDETCSHIGKLTYS